jgi:hypothetical protein
VVVPAAAVKSHLGWTWAARLFLELADLLKPNDIGPELMGLFDIPYIQHEVIDSSRRNRFVGHQFSSSMRCVFSG